MRFALLGRTAVALVVLVVFSLAVAACGGGSKKKTTTTTSRTSAHTSAQATTTSSTSTTAQSSAGVASNWTLPGANLQNTRDVASPINSSNVSTLHLAWSVPIKAPGTFGGYAATPVVVDGVLYSQDLASNVQAIQLSTGKVLWTHVYNSPNEGPDGVTVSNGTVFAATSTSAVALQASTGEQIWTKKLIRNHNEGIDMAPGYYNGTVYVSTVPGNPKAFYAGNGKAILWALNAKTGATDWKWDEVGDLWSHGSKKLMDINSGGGQWDQPSFDTQGNIYVGVSNPGPIGGVPGYPWGTSRPGPNLYTDSVVKLSPQGKVLWYYQLTPHDLYDHDVQYSPILSTANGQPVAIDGGKGGIMFEVSAATGKLLWKLPIGKHNGHDNDGLLTEHLKPSAKMPLPKVLTMLPGIQGGIETQMASNGTTTFAAVNDFPFEYGATGIPAAAIKTLVPKIQKAPGELVAVNQDTGKIRWDDKLPSAPFGAANLTNDLVFTTTFNGMLEAFKQSTGALVWKAKLPAWSIAPVTISGDYVITGAGYAQSGSQRPAIVAYKLGATSSSSASSSTTSATTTTSSGTATSSSSSSTAGVSLKEGMHVFETAGCASCHTLAAAGSTGTVGPNLDQLKPSDAAVVKQVTNGGGGMPAFGSSLSKSQIQSVALFVSSVAGKAKGKGKGGKSSGSGVP
jgi:outer membrane protein assembly factor BamB